MYNLPYHKEKNPEAVKAFIAKHPFALLTGCDSENKPAATQVPLFFEEVSGRKILRGHIMRNTAHHKAFLHNNNVLAVFTGAHCYVSGTWYSNPHTPSTWNYMSVHVKGTIRFLEGDALIDILRKTSLHFENYNEHSATFYDNLSPDFLKRVMHMIAAFEIEVTEIDNVFKLSQDRDEESFHNIIEKLRPQGENGKAIAEAMEKITGDLFPEEQQKAGGK